jgi:hypothetical protein
MPDSEGRNLWLFFLIAFAITWSFGIPAPLLTPSDTEPVLFDVAQLGALSPALAAIVIIYRERGRVGLREFAGRIVNWRIGLVWYAAILSVPLIWHAILPAIGVYGLLNGSLPTFAEPSRGAPPWTGACWFFLYILFIERWQTAINRAACCESKE